MPQISSSSKKNNFSKSKRYKWLVKFLGRAVLVGVALIVLLSSSVYLYSEKDRIIQKLNRYGSEEIVAKDDVYWAEKILEGGFILHFRHAERDKWIDVQMYDALESDVHQNGENESRYAENDYFAKAVCLNERGKIQAKAIGEHLANIEFPIGTVVSSVSCRARQTAELAFGGYDSLHRLLVHKGPYNESKHQRLESLIEFYSSLSIKEGTNTIVSAHNSVVRCGMFENCFGESLNIEEGGFYVIAQRDGALYLEHTFHNYNNFNMVFYKR